MDLDGLLAGRLAALSLEQKVRLLTGADFWSLPAEPAAGLRRVVTSDGPAGVRGKEWDERDPSLNVPSPTALAATWDERLVEGIGALLASEARRKGVHVLLAPTVNLHRTPYAGRHFECYSEDPLLSARIGVALVNGLQRNGIGACVKHFVANDSETGRMGLDVRVGERALRELYLAPFEAIVAAGVWAVMAAYNGVHGVPMTEHPMLASVLRGEWDFDGVVMSDWFATSSTVDSARAGLDLVMPGPSGPWGPALVAAVRDGQVAESDVDAKVLRVLRLAARAGALDGIDASPAVPAGLLPAGTARRRLREAAAAGFVLVRNENAVLPLDPAGLRRVAVLGPNAARARTLGGGSATVFPARSVSPVDGLRAALGGDGRVVRYEAGVAGGERVTGELELLRPPGEADDAPAGVLVEFLDGTGAVIDAQTRSACTLTWVGCYPGRAISRAVSLRVRADLLLPAGGGCLAGVAGLGQFVLTAGGVTVLDETIGLPPGADPVRALVNPPQRCHPMHGTPGERIPLVLTHRLPSLADLPIDLPVPRPAAPAAPVAPTVPPSPGAPGPDEPRPPERDVVALRLSLLAAAEPDPPEVAMRRAVDAARDADAAVVVVGTTEEVESEGFDRTSLALPGDQDELVRRVAEVNPRTVVVVNSGAPVVLPWADEVPAVLLSWFPGQEFGDALADVLLGRAEPGGRLPTGWPVADDPAALPAVLPHDGVLEYAEDLLVGHRAGPSPAVRYPFGAGLGYTSWEYQDLWVDPPDSDGVRLAVTVRNSGDRAGREVVQVYARRPGSTVTRPERWLAGFAGARAEPGERVTVQVRLPRRVFEHWGEGGWVLEPGRFELLAGRSSVDLPLRAELDPGTAADRPARRPPAPGTPDRA
jgi:beta-glucosidase